MKNVLLWLQLCLMIVGNFSISAYSLGYNCGQYNISTAYNNDCGTIISSGQTLNSTNCTSVLSIVRGNTFSCSFALIGNGGNTYILPVNGVIAKVNSVSTFSPSCTISNNVSMSAVLICNQIPTNSGTEGVQNIELFFNGSAIGIIKGSVTLSIPSSGTVITYPIITPSSNCNRFKSIYVGTRFQCAFLLVGDPTNTYILPPKGVQVGIPSLVSSSCNIEDNGTPNARLICGEIVSDVMKTGKQDVVVYVDGVNEGEVSALPSDQTTESVKTIIPAEIIEQPKQLKEDRMNIFPYIIAILIGVVCLFIVFRIHFQKNMK